MNERTTLEIIAPTVEEALAQGLAQLGLPADAVSVEVLDSGNKGLFGLGGRQVRVRLSVNPPKGSEPVNAKKVEMPVMKPEPKIEKPAPTPEKEAQPVKKNETMPDGHDPILDKTESVISKLLYQMGMQAQVSAHYGEAREDRHPIMVDIRGNDLGVLIGHRGETLNAFQYIASLMVGKETQQFIQLIVDVEGHRDRRERQLRQLARRMAEQVIKTGRKLTLEPMPAAERRIIHMELRDHPAVTTQSSGEEPHRKITILPKE
ncbi:MAG TPA: RNA-binding cell elongation regulator Jag/EloR [Anaerolineales bacterium]|nr:RNA-binding cell elongation regulator Jag/EloR [Anaerolineales bacterium]